MKQKVSIVQFLFSLGLLTAPSLAFYGHRIPSISSFSPQTSTTPRVARARGALRETRARRCCVVLSNQNLDKDIAVATNGVGDEEAPDDQASALDTLAALAKEDSFKNSLQNTLVVVACALVFDVGIYLWKGFEPALDFVSGFLVEESLSVDNLFVFLLLFDYFKVPLSSQERVLSFGILGAVVLRLLFISAGAVALESFRPVLLVFGGILIASSAKILLQGAEDEDDENLSDNAIVQFATKVIDTTDEYDGNKFFTEQKVEDANAEDGFTIVRRATPLLLVLVCVELTDIVFAVDSVPAVFGVTEDPFIVFTSNIFAILGLRSLYSILSRVVEKLPYLPPAVGLILGFVGVKLVAEYFGISISDEASLGIISTCLAGGVGLSLWAPVKR